jgi:hypothetical protein
LKTKKIEFAPKYNRNTKYTLHQYLKRCIFTNIHEAFFCEFPHLLQEWILRLKENHLTNRIRPVEWITENIAQLKKVNNKFTHAVDFWLDNIIVEFITEFAVDIEKSYTTVEHRFLKGPRGSYIISLYTSINILLHDKGVMKMESDN